MKINRKFLLIGVVIGGLAWATFLGGRFILKSRQPVLKTAKVERGTLIQAISASGKIKAADEVNLQFQTSGRLAWVGVKEGDKVVAGQTTAQLDQRELEKNLQKSLRDYSIQRNVFEETFRVTYREQTPQTVLTDTIKRILEKNQWDLEKAVLDVELKDLALKYSVLTTPISGIVTRIDAPIAGVNIVPQNAIFTISSPDSVVFSANIDEADIGSVQQGQEATIILDAYPNQKFTGKVGRVAFSATTTSGGGTAFPVEVSLPSNDGVRFKIGMNGDAEITLAKKENVLLVPSEVVIEREGKNFLLTLKDGGKTEIEVTIGLKDGANTEIISGVQEGEIIIIPR